MAKKIRKRTPSSIPPAVLFIELLIPWIVMGVVSVALAAAGIKGITILVIALASALAATVLVGYYERARKIRAAHIVQESSRRRP